MSKKLRREVLIFLNVILTFYTGFFKQRFMSLDRESMSWTQHSVLGGFRDRCYDKPRIALENKRELIDVPHMSHTQTVRVYALFIYMGTLLEQYLAEIREMQMFAECLKGFSSWYWEILHTINPIFEYHKVKLLYYI